MPLCESWFTKGRSINSKTLNGNAAESLYSEFIIDLKANDRALRLIQDLYLLYFFLKERNKVSNVLVVRGIAAAISGVSRTCSKYKSRPEN